MVSLFSFDVCKLECSNRSLPGTYYLFSVDSLNELCQLEHGAGEKSTAMDAVIFPDGKK